MSDIIQLLSDAVANQIAAGEVIQRPASALKELLENAIDAGSTQIEVFVKDSGKTLIQVIDNGCGMSSTDARRSFERHATSKIRSADDLFSIRTMGFRGEALASIAAVAQVELKTRREEDEVGTWIHIEGSDVKKQEAVSTASGTSFVVRNLFYNVPARRHFLKSNNIEARHIIEEFERVALAHPEIALSLNQNGMEVFRLPIGNPRQRIVNLYGSNYNERVVPVQEETSLLRIQGFVGKPEFARKTRGEQFFFVNQRFIKDHYLHHAVTNAFEELLPRDSYPSYWIFIDIDPSKIDVNIHPTKTEIKFEDERSVYAIIRAAIKRSLGQYSVSPTLDFEREKSFDIPHAERFKPVAKPGYSVNTGYNPFREERKKTDISGWEKLYEGLGEVRTEAAPEAEPTTAPLFHPDELPVQANDEALFQLSRAIVVSSRSGTSLMMIDQQAAHERILFERFLNRSGEPAPPQMDLFPTTMQFSAQDSVIIQELSSEWHHFGFELQEFGLHTFVLQGRPEIIERGTEKEVIEHIIEQYKNQQAVATSGTHERMAKALARSLAIKRGRKLSRPEMQQLVNDLLKCQEPALGIDGKACSWLVSTEEILTKMRR